MTPRVVVRVKHDGAGMSYPHRFYADGGGTTDDLQKAMLYSPTRAEYMKEYDWVEVLPVTVTVVLT